MIKRKINNKIKKNRAKKVKSRTKNPPKIKMKAKTTRIKISNQLRNRKVRKASRSKKK